MGHVILIAEDLVKFFARCPQELWEVIQDSFVPSEWEAFVDGSLRETKDRDAKPLAGGKPMQTPGPDGTPKSEDSDDDDDEIGVHKFGEPLTRTMAQGGEGYEAYEDRNESGDDDDSVSHLLIIGVWLISVLARNEPESQTCRFIRRRRG